MKKLFSPFFVIAALLFLFFFLLGLLKTTIRYFTLNREVKNVEKTVLQLDRENRDLLGSLQFLKGNFFLEEEARTKFGLKKPGETLVIVPKSEEQKRQEEQKERSEIKEKNIKLWWKYFFGS